MAQTSEDETKSSTSKTSGSSNDPLALRLTQVEAAFHDLKEHPSSVQESLEAQMKEVLNKKIIRHNCPFASDTTGELGILLHVSMFMSCFVSGQLMLQLFFGDYSKTAAFFMTLSIFLERVIVIVHLTDLSEVRICSDTQTQAPPPDADAPVQPATAPLSPEQQV